MGETSIAAGRSSRPLASPIAAGLVHFAHERPDRLAAWSGDRGITFCELDGLAGTLAHTLLDHFPPGAPGPRPSLPLIVGYDVESVIAIQAAVRAGIAHVPIDAGSPPAVIRDLLPRLGSPPAAVITRPEQAALLPAGVVPLLVPRSAGSTAAPQPVAGGERALAIFTSGSTGRPKGVAISWDPLLTRNDDLLLDPHEPDPAPAALMTPLNYQFGHWRALVPSLGCPVSILEPLRLSPADLLARLDRDRMRVVMLVPSLAASIAGRWPTGRRRCLPGYLASNGGRLPRRGCRQLRTGLGRARTRPRWRAESRADRPATGIDPDPDQGRRLPRAARDRLEPSAGDAVDPPPGAVSLRAQRPAPRGRRAHRRRAHVDR
jgi:acyl-CoA synthetase (AMP-forming)/AMP-acid ligase II